MTKLRARRLGSTWRVTGNDSVSGRRRRSSSTVRALASHRQASSVRAHTPTLALPPLSPERAPATVPSGTRRVGPASGSGSGGSATSASSLLAGGGSMRSAGAVGEHGDVLDVGGGDVGDGEHAVWLGVAGRGGEVEAGVRRQGQLDGGPAERSADRLRVGTAHHAVQQGAGLLLGGGVGVVGPGERPRRVEAGELLLHERRLGLDVEAR